VTITTRLIAVRKHLSLSQRAMAQHVGVSANTWNSYETKNEAPNSGVLTRLADEGIDIHWLLTGLGSMLRTDKTSAQSQGFAELKPLPISHETLEHNGFVLIPRYDVRAAAGAGSLVEDHTLIGSVAFSREWLHRALRANPADLLVIEAKGDSMTGMVEDGDIMLIDTSEPKVRGSGIYVFLVDGLLLVKHLRIRVDGALELTGTGEEALHPEVISRDDLDRVTIIGRAIWRASRT